MIKYKRATRQEFLYCYNIRLKVFVDEQGWKTEEEIDDLDKKCIHYLAIDDDKYIATLRVYLNHGEGHIGRVCVLKEYRNQHVGFNLMKFIETDLKDINVLTLGAQMHAVPFYEKLGYTPYGDKYIEGKIEHLNMKKEI